MSCQLQKPTCKRKIMTSNKTFEKKVCPANIKQKCALCPPTCPLLPQEEATCGYAKLMGIGGDVDISQCPCKTCFLTEGCPISFNTCTSGKSNNIKSEGQAQWPDKIPPCFICTETKQEPIEILPTEQLQKLVSDKQDYEKRTVEKRDPPKDVMDNSVPQKTAILRKNILDVRKCALRSSPRPLPCSECINKDLNDDCEGGVMAKTCPYLVLPDICGKSCLCPDVPRVETGPPCPFAPKPCPCCATPRCPLSRIPDCIIKPKPPCCLVPPKCSCGTCCLVKPSCQGPAPCPCGPCFVCLAPCKTSCVCFTGPSLCPKTCCSFTCPATPCCPVKCPPCLPCSTSPACPLVNSNCVCPPPACPLFPCSGLCCSPSPLCSVTNKPCPLNQPCCSSPSCIPCQLKAIECILNPCPLSSICPPIPPPCSLLGKTGSDQNDQGTDERMFHLPTCSLYDPPCELHSSFQDKQASCPFSPSPCPIGPQCPFPVTITSDRKEIYKSEKSMDDPAKLTSIENQNQLTKGRNMIPSSKQCPFSPICGVVPLPDCPAAEILCPETYRKPEKVEIKPCPFKKCMKKEGCPLSKLVPEVDCKDTNCPLKEEPECPLGELANRCPLITKCSCICPCPIPSPCCGVRPSDGVLNLTSECHYTTKDGGSYSIPHVSSTSSRSTFFSPISSSDTTLNNSTAEFRSNIQYILKSSVSMENMYSFPIEVNSSLSSSKCDLTKIDGCCSLNGPTSRLNDSSSSECPFEPLAPKTICPLAPPKCPLTPKPNTCPLTRKPEPCPLAMGGEIVCPVKFPPCKKFPGGRCPMDDINVCDCDYPVSPCLLPLQDSDVKAPPQYCFKEDCCMGLPFPPAVLKTSEGEIETGPYYQFKHTKPGKDETKYYVEVLEHPPEVGIALFGKPRNRLHDNWTVIRYGEGYLRCKSIAKKLKEIGPIENDDTQYQAEDCPIDEETRMILENRKKNLRQEKELENLKMTLGFRQSNIHTKKNKKQKKIK